MFQNELPSPRLLRMFQNYILSVTEAAQHVSE
jgi:hypothetical protein